MIKNKGRAVGLAAVAVIWAALSLTAVFKKPDEVSVSERRKLALKPELTAQNVLDGKYMTEFEKYSLDQFPLRDSFRTLKAVGAFYIFGKKDNNDIYVKDGYAAKLEYPLNETSVSHAAEKFSELYDMYIQNTGARAYISVVPDKNFFLAQSGGYPCMDYYKMASVLSDGAQFAKYIDIFSQLELEDYYKTDTHWKQEKIVDAANKLLCEMGNKPLGDYTVKNAEIPFYGVYYGQSALPLPAESISYLSNTALDGCSVTNKETGKSYTGFIDSEKANSSDPYEMFLSGASAVVTIENPLCTSGKELVMFRDSFGSSIAPLFLESYSKITLVDTRYIVPQFVGEFVSFSENTDVLFLYSSLVLNSSQMLR